MLAVFLAVMLALMPGYAAKAYAVPGDLDPSFDEDGKLTTSFGATDAARAVDVQEDGKIVVAGYTHNGTNRDFALTR